MTKTAERPGLFTNKAAKLIGIALVVAFIARNLFYPWVIGAMSRPQEPMRLPLFSFMSQLDLVGEAQGTYTTEVSGGQTRYYPGWFYKTNSDPQALAHALKKLLAKSNGWSLTFPNVADPYEPAAEHRTKDKVDWTLKTFGSGELLVTYRRLIND